MLQVSLSNDKKVESAVSEAQLTGEFASIRLHPKRSAFKTLHYIVLSFHDDAQKKNVPCSLPYKDDSDAENIICGVVNKFKEINEAQIEATGTSFLRQMGKYLGGKDLTHEVSAADILNTMKLRRKGKPDPHPVRIKNDVQYAISNRMNFSSVRIEKSTHHTNPAFVLAFSKMGKDKRKEYTPTSYRYGDEKTFNSIVTNIIRRLNKRHTGQLEKYYGIEIKGKPVEDQIQLIKKGIESKQYKELEEKVKKDFSSLKHDHEYISIYKDSQANAVRISFLDDSGQGKYFGYSTNQNDEGQILKALARNFTEGHKAQFKQSNGFELGDTEEQHVINMSAAIESNRNVMGKTPEEKVEKIKVLATKNQYRFFSICADGHSSDIFVYFKKPDGKRDCFIFSCAKTKDRLHALNVIASELDHDFGHQIEARYNVKLKGNADVATDLLDAIESFATGPRRSGRVRGFSGSANKKAS